MSKKTKTRLLIGAFLIGLAMVIGGEFLPKAAWDINAAGQQVKASEVNLIQIIGFILSVGPLLGGAVKWWFVDRPAAQIAKGVKK